MSIGTWDPAGNTASIDPAFLQRAQQLVESGQLGQLATVLTGEDLEQRHTMQLDEQSWKATLRELDDDALYVLMQFFTVAERDLPGWQAGAQSPVIYLNRELKRRGGKLSTEQLQWIRSNSDNRFLPNGPIM